MWCMLVELYRLTELDAGVVLADLVTLIVGEEHVCGQTTLGGVGVYGCQHGGEYVVARELLTLLLLAAVSLRLGGSLAGGLLLRHGEGRW
jgi:hypothetical protein